MTTKMVTGDNHNSALQDDDFYTLLVTTWPMCIFVFQSSRLELTQWLH